MNRWTGWNCRKPEWSILLVLFMFALIFALGFTCSPRASAADLSEQEVKQAIDRGKKFLLKEQAQD